MGSKIILPFTASNLTSGSKRRYAADVSGISGGGGSGDLLADGTVPMTANWDFGGFELSNVLKLSIAAASAAGSTRLDVRKTATATTATLAASTIATFGGADAAGDSVYVSIVSGTAGDAFLFLGDTANEDAAQVGVLNGTGELRLRSLGRIDFWATAGSSQVRMTDVGVTISSGATNPDASARLDIRSTTQGVLFPRMTTAERDLIAGPATGLMIWNTTTGQLEDYNGGWAAV